MAIGMSICDAFHLPCRRAIGMSTFDKDDEPDEFPADDSDAAGHQLQGIGISGGEGETPREREGEVGTDPGTALAVQAETALSMKGRGGAVVKSAAEYFYAKRTYWGLEAPVSVAFFMIGHSTGKLWR